MIIKNFISADIYTLHLSVCLSVFQLSKRRHVGELVAIIRGQEVGQ